jgi:Skp family chaperone for outer membrane proteins
MERETLFTAHDDQTDDETKKMESKRRNLNNQILLKKSNEITSRLEEISKELRLTESQTSGIISVLDNSSNTLKSTQQEFGTMNTAIKDGRRLLIRMNRREFTDKLLIVLCLCFFFFVVFYIVFKRLF